MSNGASIDAGRKGKAVEHLVAASSILASGGQLNVSTSLVDDEGVDLVFHRRGGSATLAVQVKSRFFTSAQLAAGRFAHTVRDQTFRERDDLYLLFVAVDAEEGTFGPVWLIPSVDFARSAPLDTHRRRRFSASVKEMTRDQWRRYRVERPDLPGRLLALLGQLEAR
jgi:hypothetical protein